MDKRKLSGFLGLALAGSFAVASLFSGGSGEPAHGSYRGDYYTAGLNCSYSGGGGSSAFDTVSLIITMDTTMTHLLSGFNDALAAADIKLQVDSQVPELSYGTVRKSVPTTVYNSNTNWRSRNCNDGKVGTEDVDFAALWYIDYAAHIPANSQIVSASLNGVVDVATWYMGDADTTCATMLTDPTFDEWHTWQGAADKPHYAAVSWDYQITAGSVPNGYPAASTDPWTLPDVGSFYWDWGDVSDWSRPSATQTQVDGSHVKIGIKNCVQHAVNGGENNGIVWHGLDGNGGANIFLRAWDHATVTFTPWIEIKYLTKRYAPPMPNGSEWAFVFSTDDQVTWANEVYTDTFLAHGGTYTIYVREDQVGVTNYADFSDLVGWHGQGFEIGTHSRWHLPGTGDFGGFAAHVSNGMVQVDYDRGMAWTDGVTTVSTGWDSLLADMDPVWLHNGAFAEDANRRDADLYFGKSVAFPLHRWRPEVLKALNYHGYIAARSDEAPNLTVDGHYVRGLRAHLRPSVTDTAWGGFIQHNPLQPRNLTLWPLSLTSLDLVGTKTDTTTLTEAEVKFNTRRFIKQIKATNSGVMSLFTHALKSNTVYSSGINQDELGWILDVVDEEGGWYARASEFTRWIKQNSVPIDTPPAYAQNDSFKFYVNDGMWYLPGGLDQSFIPGMKAPDYQATVMDFGGWPIYATFDFGTSLDTYPGGPVAWYDDMAQNDLVFFNWWVLVDPSAEWINTIDELRARNPDIVIIGYTNIFAQRWSIRESPETYPTWNDLADSLILNDEFMLNTAGNDIGNQWPAQVINKTPTAAEIVAVFNLRGLHASETYLPWTGQFLDLVEYPNPPEWFCCDGGTGFAVDSMDIDQDNIAYSADSDEPPLYQAYFEDLTTLLDTGKANDHGGRTLTVANGHAATHENLAEYYDIAFRESRLDWGTMTVDGWLNDLNVFPARMRQSNTVQAGVLLEISSYIPGRMDSTQFYVSEAMSLVSLGFQQSYHEGSNSVGRNAGAPLRKLGQWKYPIGNATVVKVNDGWAIAAREFEEGIAKVSVPITPGGAPLPWEYFIVSAGGDTISRGGGWPDYPHFWGPDWTCVDGTNQTYEVQSDEAILWRVRTATDEKADYPTAWSAWTAWAPLAAGTLYNGATTLAPGANNYAHIELEVKSVFGVEAPAEWAYFALDGLGGCL